MSGLEAGQTEPAEVLVTTVNFQKTWQITVLGLVFFWGVIF